MNINSFKAQNESPMKAIDRKEHIENQYNISKIDINMLSEDILHFDKNNNLPLNYIPFPVAKYDYFYDNSFKGLQSFVFTKPYKKGRLVFFVGISPKVSKNLFEDNFEILLCIGFYSEMEIEEINQSIKANISSRNHPDYLFSGSFNNLNLNHEFVSFKTFEGASFAVVNMKLFNLAEGNLILITPYDKNYFTYKQINIIRNFVDKSHLENFIERQIKDWQIVNFDYEECL